MILIKSARSVGFFLEIFIFNYIISQIYFFFKITLTVLTLFCFDLQAGLELKENLSGGAPWPYGYPYPYDPSLAPYAFNG